MKKSSWKNWESTVKFLEGSRTCATATSHQWLAVDSALFKKCRDLRRNDRDIKSMYGNFAGRLYFHSVKKVTYGRFIYQYFHVATNSNAFLVGAFI